MQFNPDESQTNNLTDWSNEPSLENLKSDLQGAKPAHDVHVGRVDKWNNLNKVQGKAAPVKVRGRSSVQPKIVRRQNEWRYSALTEPFLGSHKLFDVKPSTAEDVYTAKQNELVLNHQFRNQLNRVSFIDNFVRTAVDEGSVILRTGWIRSTHMVKETVPVFEYVAIQSEEEMQAFQQALEAKKQSIRQFLEEASEEIKAAVKFFEDEGQPCVATIVGEEEIEVEKILVNKPTLDVLNPHNVYIDPSCGGDFDKATFVIVSFETSYAELKKESQRYKNLEKVDWENLGTINEPDHATTTPTDFQFSDKARKRTVAYEYWGFYDIEGDGTLVPIVATWIGNQIIRMEQSPFPDEKLPFILAQYLPIKRELMGEPDAELLEDNQAIIGAITRGLIDLMGRSANGQQGFAKGMLDPLNKRRYESGQDYEFNPNLPPAQGLIEHKYPEIPTSALTMLSLQNQEAESLTGVKAFANGLSGNAYGDVAAGVRGMLDAASKREMGILRRLANAVIEAGKKIAAMNAVFLSEEEVIRITDEEFVIVKREDLVGNFDIQVDISTAEVDDAKSQDLAFMLQTMGPNMDFNLTKLILAKIADLKRMPDLAKMIRLFEPKPDPLAEKAKELEIAKMELEIQEIQSKIDLNKANAEKARAQAGQADLDTFEQGAGITQQRSIENARAQATGNQDLEITRALVKPRKEGEQEGDIAAGAGYTALSKSSDDAGSVPVDSVLERDQLAPEDPSYSIGSRFFDPSIDPALNPSINIQG